MTYIEELRDVIRHLHGVESTHVESVPVKETFQGKTVWEGIVEVFDLNGHPKARRLYLDPLFDDYADVPLRSPIVKVRANGRL